MEVTAAAIAVEKGATHPATARAGGLVDAAVSAN